MSKKFKPFSILIGLCISLSSGYAMFVLASDYSNAKNNPNVTATVISSNLEGPLRYAQYTYTLRVQLEGDASFPQTPTVKQSPRDYPVGSTIKLYRYTRGGNDRYVTADLPAARLIILAIGVVIGLVMIWLPFTKRMDNLKQTSDIEQSKKPAAEKQLVNLVIFSLLNLLIIPSVIVAPICFIASLWLLVSIKNKPNLKELRQKIIWFLLLPNAAIIALLLFAIL